MRLAQTRRKANHTNHYEVVIKRVHDGDTFTCDVLLGFGVKLDNEQCRLYGFDAWEVNKTRQSVKVTDDEVAKGKQAKLALQQMVTNAKVRAIKQHNPLRDKYGRLLVDLLLDGKDVVTIMRNAGFERH